jgi:hypothetical protein
VLATATLTMGIAVAMVVIAGSSGYWELADHFSSGTMHDSVTINPDEITGLDQGVSYTRPGGNRISDWQPRKTVPEDQWTFHTKWNGLSSGPSNGTRDTSGVDNADNPPVASPTRSVFLGCWYE